MMEDEQMNKITGLDLIWGITTVLLSYHVPVANGLFKQYQTVSILV